MKTGRRKQRRLRPVSPAPVRSVRAWRPLAGLALSVIAACADSNVVVLLPEAVDEGGSAVLYTLCPNEDPFLYAFDRHHPAPNTIAGACEEGGRVFILQFAETLAELELSPGEFPFVPCTPGTFDDEGCCLTRGFPSPAFVYEAALDEPEPVFRVAPTEELDLGALQYRRSGLRFRVSGREQEVGLSSLLALPWSEGGFLLLEEVSDAARVRVRRITIEDVRVGRAFDQVLLSELEGFGRLSDAALFEDGELFLASFSSKSRRGPPSGPFTTIEHTGTAMAELLVEPGREPPRLYGISEYTGTVSKLEADAWQAFGPEIPETAVCRQPAGRAGQVSTSIWYEGAGYLVPAAGDDHTVAWPNGMWSIQDDVITWLEWPNTGSCVSLLAEVRGGLWAGASDGVLFGRREGRWMPLDVPKVADRVTRLLALNTELTLIAGDNGVFGVTDGTHYCAVPALFAEQVPDVKEVHRVGDELLVVVSEADRVKTLLVLSL